MSRRAVPPRNAYVNCLSVLLLNFCWKLTSALDCTPTTTISSVQTTTLGPGVLVPNAPTSHWCTPLQSPFNFNNPATWPLTGDDPAGLDNKKLTALHLDPSANPAVADYIVRKYNCRRSQANPRASNMLQMVWSSSAANLAAKWGAKCLVNEHDPGNPTTPDGVPCNQNLISSWPNPLTWNVAIDGWFEEWRMFVYGDPGMLAIYHEIGHYTLMMWAKSFYLGCAWANCSNTHNFICNQCPDGNAGDLSVPYATGSPCAQCPNNCDGGLCTKHCVAQNLYSNCDALDSTYKICSNIAYSGYAVSCPATCTCAGAVY
ncbi:putative Cysteine-rich secretory protein 2 [Hypsibius exemplaris]|uniref:Cysteine-rich secretory protein 2 n=1 Tax=Hypsibius exemplaris TaxID=2072580 RepID=A0A1W0X4N9_HYPEX|nr:putative Cysteine-rich secretory protein 2 [Hypsibius exemplaris]